jgi:2-methylisocitrate lyase-like PEP mutase family enzyme
MANQTELAKAFAKLHIKGEPVIIFNVWDAGTAKAAQEIGVKAIATGSWAVAAANGFADGEKIPLDFVIANLQRITASVDLPVSLDFEGGYATEPEGLRENIRRVMDAGAIGVNFEDRIVEGEGLYSIDKQSERIRALREAADEAGVPLFINARTDVVLPLDTATHTEAHLEEMIERANAYADAGASGFFAPGLINPDFIGRLCKESPLPVNILIFPGLPSPKQLADLGVGRISHGSGSYRTTMEAFKEAGRKALTDVTPASAPATAQQ